MCAETDEEARARAEGATFFVFSLGFYNSHGPVVPGTVNLWDEYQKWKDSPAGHKMRQGGLIGSPDTIRERLRKFEQSNVDQVILLNQAGKNRHEHIAESLELFAREVMPEFHEREPEHQEWKRGVLNGEIELAEIDTEAFSMVTNQTPSSKVRAASGS
jgi:alkanesulfonate monooxygenase SsuD/methylene tetrahydromethanopterin reductase-like flavin-dependent oxidoreductase (luciferase family)